LKGLTAFRDWAIAALNGNATASPIGWTDAKKVPGMLFLSAVAIHKMAPSDREVIFGPWAVDVICRYFQGEVNDFNERNMQKLFTLFVEKANSWEGYLLAMVEYEEYADRGYKDVATVSPARATTEATEALADLGQQYPGISLADAMAILESRKGTTPAPVPVKMTARERYEQAVRDAAKANG
jgi:hypothetical protein